MTGAVDEVLPVAGVLDDLAGHAVDHLAGRAGPHGLLCFLVGHAHHVIDAAQFVIDWPDGKGAGQVGRVVIDIDTPVDDQQIALPEGAVRRRGVGRGAVGAAGHDGTEGDAVRAGGQQLLGQHGGDLFLA